MHNFKEPKNFILYTFLTNAHLRNPRSLGGFLFLFIPSSLQCFRETGSRMERGGGPTLAPPNGGGSEKKADQQGNYWRVQVMEDVAASIHPSKEA